MLSKQNPRNPKFKCLQETGSIQSETNLVEANRREEASLEAVAVLTLADLLPSRKVGPVWLHFPVCQVIGNPCFYVKSPNF